MSGANASAVARSHQKKGALRGSFITAPPLRSNVLIARAPRPAKAGNVHLIDFMCKAPWHRGRAHNGITSVLETSLRRC
jgi:hypothetical protein